MNKPKVGDKYEYNNERYHSHYPVDLEVEVKRSKSNYIVIEVLNKDFVQEQYELAEKQLNRLGDWDNTLEVFDLVSRKDNKLVKNPTLTFFNLEKFHNKCNKID
jgi:hypothetical protein